MDPKLQVTLVVNGVSYGGWKAVSITAGIERQCRSFDLVVTDKWPGSTTQARRVKPFDRAQVYIGGDLVCTGYVDATPITYNKAAIAVAVKGRSKTADLVDCCPPDSGKATGGGGTWADVIGPDGKQRSVVAPINHAIQFRNQKLEVIAATLAAPYGIRVIAETDTGAAIADHTVQCGETVYESIDRMQRLRHVLATDNERGDLVFIDVGSEGTSSERIEVGKNVFDCSAPLDYKDVFSEYICKGQRPGEVADDDSDVSNLSESSSSINDVSVGRLRVRVFKQTGAADEGTCGDRVDYERSHRAAKALETVYTVRDTWRQLDGSLWRPNLLVPVVDPILGVAQTMVIAEVTWSINDQGMSTILRVGPADGYRTKAAKGKKKGSGAGAGWSTVQ